MQVHGIKGNEISHGGISQREDEVSVDRSDEWIHRTILGIFEGVQHSTWHMVVET